ncbi:alpha amylase C-terminal domain-containing protein [Vibrio sp. PP-XX7]
MGSGFVVINRDDSKGIDQTFSTGMPAGEYCNVIAGNYDERDHSCSGEIITVDSEMHTLQLRLRTQRRFMSRAKIGLS